MNSRFLFVLSSTFSAPVTRHFEEDSELILQQEQVVCCGDCDDVFMRVPSRVEDLLVEVQAVDVDLVLLALPPSAHLEKN